MDITSETYIKQKDEFCSIVLKQMNRLYALPNHRISCVTIKQDTKEDTAYYDPKSREIVVTSKLIDTLLEHGRNLNASIKSPLRAVESVALHEAFHSMLTRHWVAETNPFWNYCQQHLEDTRINTNVVKWDPKMESGFNFTYTAIDKKRTEEGHQNDDYRKSPLSVLAHYLGVLSGLSRTSNCRDYVEQEIENAEITPLDHQLLDDAATGVTNSCLNYDLFSKLELVQGSIAQLTHYESFKEQIALFLYPKKDKLDNFFKAIKKESIEDILKGIDSLISPQLTEEELIAEKKFNAMSKEQLHNYCETMISTIKSVNRAKDTSPNESNVRLLLVADRILRDVLIQELDKDIEQSLSEDISKQKEEHGQSKGNQEQSQIQGEPLEIEMDTSQDPSTGATPNDTPSNPSKELQDALDELGELSESEAEQIKKGIETAAQQQALGQGDGNGDDSKKRKTLSELLEEQRNNHAEKIISPEDNKSHSNSSGGIGYSKVNGAEELAKIGSLQKARDFRRDNKGIIRAMKNMLKMTGMVSADHKGAFRSNQKRTFINATNVSVNANHSLPPKNKPMFRQASKTKEKGKKILDMEQVHILLDSSGSMSGTEPMMKKFLGSFYSACKDAKIPTSLIGTDNGTTIYSNATKTQPLDPALGAFLDYNACGGTDFGKVGVDSLMKQLTVKGEKTRILGITDCILPPDDVTYLNKQSSKFGAPMLLMAINGSKQEPLNIHKHAKNVPIIWLQDDSDKSIINFFGACFDWMRNPKKFIEKNGTFIDTTHYKPEIREKRAFSKMDIR